MRHRIRRPRRVSASFSVTLVVAGLSMVGLAVHAYLKTERQEMLYLSIGFSVVVAAAIGTTILAFLTQFGHGSLTISARLSCTLLAVNGVRPLAFA